MAWKIDAAHSHVGFSVRHMVVSTVHGGFGKFSGTLNVDEANPANSSVEGEVETASISTNDANRDNHLRSADFFDAEQYPTITFNSTSIEKSGDDYKVAGDLTLHGVTKPATFTVEYAGVIKDAYGMQRAGFSAKTKISRKEFGLTWNNLLETGGAVVSDDVKIELDLAATQQ